MGVQDDDVGIGRPISRRKALSLLSAVGAIFLFGNGSSRAQGGGACAAVSEQTEGPYFVDTKLARSDIRSDTVSGTARAGVPLIVTFIVSRMNGGGCTPLRDAQVELWQCDAHGLYSGVRDPSFDTSDQNFLRGYQITDSSGLARFTTIYPGWYPGRTVHLHFMIRAAGERSRGEVFTSQLYFDDAVTDKIFTRPPYNERAARTSRNNSDGIFRGGGTQLLLPVNERGQELAGNFHVALKGSING